jgi:hypothetical protein
LGFKKNRTKFVLGKYHKKTHCMSETLIWHV